MGLEGSFLANSLGGRISGGLGAAMATAPPPPEESSFTPEIWVRGGDG